MGFSLVPRHVFREVTDITPGFLEELGIKFLMLDLDNTLAAYDEHVLSDSISRWIADIRDSGIKMFIISNSSRKKRVKTLSESAGIEYIMKSHKPSPKGLLCAMEMAGFGAGESALAGDQVFTDVLAANRAGAISIIVRPRRFTNPFLALRYYIEAPFRFMCRRKIHEQY
jgi:hypothetical protein